MDHASRRLLVLALIVAALAAVLLWPDGGEATVIDPVSTFADSHASESSTSVIAAGLQPGLDRAVAAALVGARNAGYDLSVTSGFRTVDEQERLLAEAIDEHGSREEALRWVFEPERSMHVQGFAVDMGDRPAAAWLEEHGARYGLCRTLAWEWWHFEWRTAWEASATCPAPVDDPAEAPGT